MEPTFKNGSIVIGSSIPYLFSRPKKHDIVVFKFDKKIFIKRIKQIKDGRYFLAGDNAKDSLDSRKIGWIERENILGKVLFVSP